MATRPSRPDLRQPVAYPEIDKKEATGRTKRIGSQQASQRKLNQSLWRSDRSSRLVQRANEFRLKSRRSRSRMMRMKVSLRLMMKSKSPHRRHPRILRHPRELPLDLNWDDGNPVTRRREESRQLLEFKGRQLDSQLLALPRRHRLTPHHRGVWWTPNRHMSVLLGPDLIWKM